MNKKAPEKELAAKKKPAAKKKSVAVKKAPARARKAAPAKRAAPAKKATPVRKAVPAKRAIAVRRAAPPGGTKTQRVIAVIKTRTGVRPVLLESTLSSLAIVTNAQLTGLAGRLGDEFNVPASNFDLSGSTTVNAIVDMV